MNEEKWLKQYLELVHDCQHYITIKDHDRVKVSMELIDKMLEVRPTSGTMGVRSSMSDSLAHKVDLLLNT